MKDVLNTQAPRVLSVLRIMAGLLFFAHGTQKILGFPAAEWEIAAFSLPWVAGVLELVGGSLIILGLFTRVVAFILSGQMAFAYFIGHAGQSFFPTTNGGDAAILFCFIFFFLIFSGPGNWSMDKSMGRE